MDVILVQAGIKRSTSEQRRRGEEPRDPAEANAKSAGEGRQMKKQQPFYLKRIDP